MPLSERQKKIINNFIRLFILWYHEFTERDWKGKRQWRSREFTMDRLLSEVGIAFNQIDDEELRKAWEEARGYWEEDWEYIVENEERWL